MSIGVIAAAAYISQEMAAEFGPLPPGFRPMGNNRLFRFQTELLHRLADRDGAESIAVSKIDTFRPSYRKPPQVADAGCGGCLEVFRARARIGRSCHRIPIDAARLYRSPRRTRSPISAVPASIISAGRGISAGPVAALRRRAAKPSAGSAMWRRCTMR